MCLKRERIVIVGTKKGTNIKFEYPKESKKIKTLRELAEDSVKPGNSETQYSFDSIRRDRAERLQREDSAIQLEGDEASVYKALEENLITIDEVLEKTGLGAPKALAALTVLAGVLMVI